MTAHIYIPLWLGIGVPWIALCLIPWEKFPRSGGAWRADQTLRAAVRAVARRFHDAPPHRTIYDRELERVTVYHRTKERT